MDSSRNNRAPLFAPLIGLVLIGVAITAWIYASPDSLFGIAAGVLVLCGGLIAGAVVARRWRPRNEVPSVERVERWIAAAAGWPAPDRVRALLRRLGEWPHLLDDLPAGLRDRVARVVDEARVAASLEAWTGADEPRDRRIGALHLLGWLRLPDAELRLRSVLADGDPDVAQAAASALVRVGTGSAYGAVLQRIGNGPLPGSRLAALLEGAEPERLLPALRAQAADPAADRRFWVAHLAGRTGAPEALPLLLAFSTDTDLSVRANAAEGLGRLGLETARDRLHALLADPSWVVQAHAARALGELGPDASVEALAGLLASPHWWVRENVVRALAAASPATIPALRPFLHRLEGDARRSLVDVLLRLGFLDGPGALVGAEIPDGPGGTPGRVRPPAPELARDLGAIEAVGAGAAIPDPVRARYGLPPRAAGIEAMAGAGGAEAG